MLRVVVLGAAAGGGVPQWNCGCRVCQAARTEHPELQSTQASLAVTRFLGVNQAGAPPTPGHLLIASATLAMMAGLTVWGKGKLRLFSSLLTLTAGYAAFEIRGARSRELLECLTAIDVRPLDFDDPLVSKLPAGGLRSMSLLPVGEPVTPVELPREPEFC